MTPRSFLALSLVLAFSLASVAAAKDAQPAAGAFDVERFRIPHEMFVLPNGLTVLVHEDHSVPVVAVNSWYHVGSKNEKPGRTGFAHLFEHFFFNGSENHPHGFREAMDDLGANNRNGTTNSDRTNFFQDVPVSGLERTLYLEADRLGFLEGFLSEEMLERERGVVKNEKRQRENRPYGQVFSRFVERIYPAAHPYSWTTIGRMEDLDAATLEDVAEWYRTYYAPGNVVLSLAGDITVDRAKELVTKYFGDIPPGPPLARPERWVPTLGADIRESMEDRVPQARIYRLWPAPPWGDPELLHLQLFGSVLSGSKSSPLDRALVYDQELATGVSARPWDSEIASLFNVTLTPKPGVAPAEVEAAMETVLAKLLEEGPPLADLERAKARMFSSFARGLERLGGFGGRSDVLAECMTYGGDPDAYLEHLAILAQATPDEVAATARKWLRGHHYTLTVTPLPERKATPSDLDRSQLPALAAAPDVAFPEMQRATLSNGLDVILLERHTAPLVNATLVLDAGEASDAPETAGLASLAMELLTEGTKTRDAFELADALDAIGAQVSTGTGRDISTVRLRALATALEPSLELFADIALNPSFPEDMVGLQVKRRVAGISQEKANPSRLVGRLAGGLLYGKEHPYAVAAGGSGHVETVASLTRKDFINWHRAWVTPGRSTLVVAGDVTMDELRPLAEAAFGRWKKGSAPTKAIGAATADAAGKVYLIDKPGAPQSVIAAAHVTEPGGHPQDLALDVVMRNFGGIATSRLNRNLRLDKHWSYGAWGGVGDARGPRTFQVFTSVQSDKTSESMQEIRQEIRDVAGERPLAGEELESIMRNTVLRLPGRYATLSSLEGAAIEVVNMGLPEGYFAEYAKNVRQLGERDFAEAGRTFVHPDRLTWLVVGDLASIEEKVRALGYGDVIVLDADGNVVGDGA